MATAAYDVVPQLVHVDPQRPIVTLQPTYAVKEWLLACACRA
jgi:hypothetical protein